VARLQQLDVDSAEFDRQFAEFTRAVHAHAEQEEAEVLPTLRKDFTEEDRRTMAEMFIDVENEMASQ
jgi:hypothetical protein